MIKHSAAFCAAAMRSLLVFAVLTPWPVTAASLGGYHVAYTGYSHGFTVLKLSADILMTPAGYTAHVTFHTAGVIGMLVHSDNDSRAIGNFQGTRARPTLFEVTGHLRGTYRQIRITYAGDVPRIEALSPPVEQERTSVPPADTARTIDTLSAVIALIRQVGQSGRCDGSATTFDGRRLAIQSVHTTGLENLPKTGQSVFAGQATRCDFDGRQLAGFIRTENEDDLRKPRHGTAWLADVLPGAPPVPVRVAFDNKLLGQVTLYLTEAEAAGPVAAK